MKKRLIEFLAYLEIGQSTFEKNVGLSNGFVNNVGDSIREASLAKILSRYPELNTNWLKTGEGKMLRPVTNIEGHHGGFGQVNDSKGVFVGQMNGGNHSFNNDDTKDLMIDEQKKEVLQMFDIVLKEVHGFQEASKRHDEYIVRQDDYIKKQDEYISNIVKQSYLRNERNMERTDKDRDRLDNLMLQQNALIQQQNELIKIIDRQNQKVQERADRLLDLLEKKL
jgi:hypothetical protein